MNKTLLENIAAYMDKGDYVINDTITYLTKLKVTVGAGNVVDTECRIAFIKVRDAIIAHYLDTRAVGKATADRLTGEFLAECGYRLRKKKVAKQTKKTPTKWKKAVSKSVFYATKGDDIMIGKVVYTRA